MKSFAVMALLAATSVTAANHRRHGHAELHEKHAARGTGHAPAYGCTTYTTTWYGEPTLVQDKPKPSTSTCTESSTSSVVPSSTSTWVPPPPPSSTSTWEAPSSTSTWEAPSSTSTWEAPSSTSTWEAPAPTSTWEAPSPSSTWVAPTSSPAPAPSAVSKASTPPANGNQWAMAYTPYTSGGQCKSADQVASDIKSIKSMGFTTVRLYATDCSGVTNVGHVAASIGLKIILGIYIDGSGIGANTDAQISTIISWGQWDIVEMVVAGNEAIFNNFVSASALASFVLDVKAKFGAQGYSGPVTTTEPLGTFQQHADTLCPAVDIAGANIHAFFNAAVSADGAGAFVASQLQLLAAACGGSKPAYNLETGWPSGGSANGDAVPSPANQVAALKSILEVSGHASVMFAFENDSWKAPGDLGVEQYWGCGNLFQGTDSIINQLVGDVKGVVSGIEGAISNII